MALQVTMQHNVSRSIGQCRKFCTRNMDRKYLQALVDHVHTNLPRGGLSPPLSQLYLFSTYTCFMKYRSLSTLLQTNSCQKNVSIPGIWKLKCTLSVYFKVHILLPAVWEWMTLHVKVFKIYHMTKAKNHDT